MRLAFIQFAILLYRMNPMYAIPEEFVYRQNFVFALTMIYGEVYRVYNK